MTLKKMLKPVLPKQIIDEPLDTSYEFAEANFRGWWQFMREKFNYNEIEMIEYVSNFRHELREAQAGAEVSNLV